MLYHYRLLSRVGWIESLTMLKELFKNDVVAGLAPLFYKEPEIKIYAVVNVVLHLLYDCLFILNVVLYK